MNCWTVQLLPFYGNERNDIKLVDRLQNEICLEEKVFGMGWSDDGKTDIHILKEIFKNYTLKDKIPLEEAIRLINLANKMRKEVNEKLKKEDNKRELGEINLNEESDEIEISELFIGIYSGLNRGEPPGLRATMNSYKRIEENDIVIARLKSGEYCVGRVKNTEIKFINERTFNKQWEILNGKVSAGFSWCCEVYKWYIYSESEIPGHISGRFCSRSVRTTINHIAQPQELKQLVKKIYFNKENNDDDFEGEKLNMDIPTISLRKDTFTQSLHPYDLEDLVYLYILEKQKTKYKLLPSKCKIDEVRYECYLMCEDDPNKVIGFQVKNQESIDCELYKNDELEKIYLFSGKGYVHKEVERENANMKIISNEELFDTLQKSVFFKQKFNKKYGYYEIRED